MLDVRQGLTVERRHPTREAVDEAVERGLGNGAVDIPVPLGQLSGEVLAPEQDLERPAPSDQAWQPRRGAASRNSTDADFRLTEHGPLAAGEADVAGENELTARAAGAP